eukprot:INCI14729.3.p1 GENE.INCI14729.3~~INCI14729.3.p1  ORF type:complete len:729 (+),score=113.14 INCI14729.3:146-2332(+)
MEEAGGVSQNPLPAKRKSHVEGGEKQPESPLNEESVAQGDAPAVKRGRAQGSAEVEAAPSKPSLEERLCAVFAHLRNVSVEISTTAAADCTTPSASETAAEIAPNNAPVEVCVTFDLRAGEGVAMRGKFELAVERGEVTAQGFTLRQPSHSTSGGDGQFRSLIKADFEVGDWDPSPLLQAGLAGARVSVTGGWWQSARRKKSKQSASAARTSDADLNEVKVSFAILDETMYFTGSTASTAQDSSPANPVFLTPMSWVKYSEELLQLPQQQHIRILICGAKGSGKSTLAKYLANRFLSDSRRAPTRKVLFVNTDVGQTELTPPGIVATHCLSGHDHQAFAPQPLQGASFVNSRHFSPTQAAAYFVGTANPELHPPLYIESLRALCADTMSAAERCENESSDGRSNHEPCGSITIVNTAGWIQGLGLRFLHYLLRFSAPTHIVQTSSNAPLDAELRQWEMESRVSSATGIIQCDIRKFDPPHGKHGDRRQKPRNAPGAAKAMSSAELRTLSLVRYFGEAAVLEDSSAGSAHASAWKLPALDPTATNGALGQAIASLAPFQISFQDISLEILHCGHIPFKDYLSVMNGGIVGLCTLQTASNPDILGQGWSCSVNNAQQEEQLSTGGSETDGHVRRVSEGPAHMLPKFLASSDQGNGLQPIYRCVGLGIVRAVDPDTRKVYIVTPLDEELLADVDLLVKGDLQVRSVFSVCLSQSLCPTHAEHRPCSVTGAF